MIAVTSMLLHSSHQHSPIAPDHSRPSRSIPALPFALVARAPVRPSPTRCSYFRRRTRSRGHHVTVAQPHIMQAASLATHLVGRHGLWGSQPPFHAILVSYTLLMSLYRAQDRWTRVFSHSRIGGYLYAFLSLAPGAVPRPLHADSHLSDRDPRFPAPIIDPFSRPCVLGSYK